MNSGRNRRALPTAPTFSFVNSGTGDAVEHTTTSAAFSSAVSSSKGRAVPPTSAASASARASVRLVTISRPRLAYFRCRAASSPISPAPTTSAVLSDSSSNTFARQLPPPPRPWTWPPGQSPSRCARAWRSRRPPRTRA